MLADGRGLRSAVAARLTAEDAAGERLFAPAPVDAEAAKVLERLAGKELPEDRATAAIDELAAMDLVRCTFSPPAAADLGTAAHSLYPFDAVYAALAEDLGAPLVTTDGKFEPVRAQGIIRCAVETLTL